MCVMCVCVFVLLLYLYLCFMYDHMVNIKCVRVQYISHLFIFALVMCRVTTHLQNLEKLGNSKVVRENVKSQEKLKSVSVIVQVAS